MKLNTLFLAKNIITDIYIFLIIENLITLLASGLGVNRTAYRIAEAK